jgi:hypothetical protein
LPDSLKMTANDKTHRISRFPALADRRLSQVMTFQAPLFRIRQQVSIIRSTPRSLIVFIFSHPLAG